MSTTSKSGDGVCRTAKVRKGGLVELVVPMAPSGVKEMTTKTKPPEIREGPNPHASLAEARKVATEVIIRQVMRAAGKRHKQGLPTMLVDVGVGNAGVYRALRCLNEVKAWANVDFHYHALAPVTCDDDVARLTGDTPFLYCREGLYNITDGNGVCIANAHACNHTFGECGCGSEIASWNDNHFCTGVNYLMMHMIYYLSEKDFRGCRPGDTAWVVVHEFTGDHGDIGDEQDYHWTRSADGGIVMKPKGGHGTVYRHRDPGLMLRDGFEYEGADGHMYRACTSWYRDIVGATNLMTIYRMGFVRVDAIVHEPPRVNLFDPGVVTVHRLFGENKSDLDLMNVGFIDNRSGVNNVLAVKGKPTLVNSWSRSEFVCVFMVLWVLAAFGVSWSTTLKVFGVCLTLITTHGVNPLSHWCVDYVKYYCGLFRVASDEDNGYVPVGEAEENVSISLEASLSRTQTDDDRERLVCEKSRNFHVQKDVVRRIMKTIIPRDARNQAYVQRYGETDRLKKLFEQRRWIKGLVTTRLAYAETFAIMWKAWNTPYEQRRLAKG